MNGSAAACRADDARTEKRLDRPNALSPFVLTQEHAADVRTSTTGKFAQEPRCGSRTPARFGASHGKWLTPLPKRGESVGQRVAA